ncbi:MAG TPA: hypothetical protein VFI29_07050 [Hanamia sp.]|nr:hypothetical protein [Hanamia sp.]
MKKLFVLSVLSLLVFSSCKKEITQVQQVNQAFSAVYTIAPSDWTTNNGGLSYTASLQIPELDNSIYVGGGVLVYLSFSGTDYYEALPEVFDGFTYGAIHSNGYVSIDISDITGNIMNPPTQSISAKVILIDAQSLGLHKDVNLNDLKAVQKAFNVK